jgi:hypothetical protein
MVVTKKWVINLSWILCLADFYGAVGLTHDYTLRMPQTAQIQQGRTNAIEGDYGRTVYVTLREKRQLDALYIFVPILAGAYVLIMFWFAKKEHQSESS